MKKLPLLLVLSVFCIYPAFSQITALTGIQVVNGLTVTVSRSNPQPNSVTLCSTGPYQIGRNYSDWYQYDFLTQPASHFTVKMIRLHDNDSIEIKVNGLPYNVTGATAYNGDVTCNLPSANVNFPGNGLITTTGGATGTGQGIQFDITLPGAMINSVRITHIRAANNIKADDVIYMADCRLDTCNMIFKAERGQQICAGKDLQLTATNYPNTTYKWTPDANTPPPVFDPSDDVREPVMKKVAPINSGTYYVTATRGACVYRDTLKISILPPPQVGPVKQVGPLCPGGDDTLSLPSILLPTGGDAYAWHNNSNTLIKFDAGYSIAFPSIQPPSRGVYSIYAVDLQGCTSDTVDFFFDVLTGVFAGFNYKIKEGCVQDTVVFENNSIGHKTVAWEFGDNTPVVTDSDPTHHYLVPKPNDKDRVYTVELRIQNTSCGDTVKKDIDLSHRLVPKFYIDDDSICQGAVITFSDSTKVKVGTAPITFWDYGDGNLVRQAVQEHTFQYDVAGIYHPKLYVTDYLGCIDSYSLELVVDSTGYIAFDIDEESVCLGDDLVFTGEYYAGGALMANWDFNDGILIPNQANAFHAYNEPGTYKVTFSVDYRICPGKSVSKDVHVKPVPQVYLGEDTAICPNGKAIYISDRINPTNSGVTYKWNTGTGDASRGINIRHAGIYAVTAELDGCSAADTVEVKKNCYINIPNAFTPNNDGKSDYFLPRQLLSRNIQEFRMQVYNRWGQQVFVTQSANGRGWDGKLNGEDQPLGVYVYTIQVTFGDGNTEHYHGNVSLLR